MRYFDYESVAREAGLSDSQVSALCRLMRAEFPRDDMLYELHVLRACYAIRDGWITFDQAVEAEPAPGGRSIA